MESNNDEFIQQFEAAIKAAREALESGMSIEDAFEAAKQAALKVKYDQDHRTTI